jgi:hypothetical protein
MKVIALAGLVLALSSPLAASAAKGAHDHSPRHGGIVTEAGNVDLELVLKADAITLHLRDHGKALKIEGGSAKLTLLSGANKQDVVLAPAGEGRFEARGTFPAAAGTKAVTVVILPGRKPLTARFAIK